MCASIASGEMPRLSRWRRKILFDADKLDSLGAVGHRAGLSLRRRGGSETPQHGRRGGEGRALFRRRHRFPGVPGEAAEPPPADEDSRRGGAWAGRGRPSWRGSSGASPPKRRGWSEMRDRRICRPPLVGGGPSLFRMRFGAGVGGGPGTGEDHRAREKMIRYFSDEYRFIWRSRGRRSGRPHRPDPQPRHRGP